VVNVSSLVLSTFVSQPGVSQTVVENNTGELIIQGDIHQIIEIGISRPEHPPFQISRTAIDRDKFVGRDGNLNQLRHQLHQAGTLALTAIEGMGGVGKTELALQYADRSIESHHYPGGVLWLDARGIDIFKEIQDFAATYLNFVPPEKQDQSKQVQACWHEWSSLFEGDKLLVIDDVTKDSYQEIYSYLPRNYRDIKVIITTRLRIDPRIIKSLSLDVLDEINSLRLLKKLVDNERIERELEVAKKLCRWVGYLPLGLTLLGRYLNYLPVDSLEELLEKLEEEGIDSEFMRLIEEDESLNIPFGDRQLYEGVYTVFNLSWKYLTQGGKQLGALLSLFDIPPYVWSMVEKVAPSLAEIRGGATNNLGDIHIIHGQESNPLHPLIQDFFLKKLREDEHFLGIHEILFDNFVFQQYVYDTGYLENNLKQLEKVRNHLNLRLNNLKGDVILGKMIGHGYYADRSVGIKPAVENMMLSHTKVVNVYQTSSERDKKVWLWYQLFLLDHAHNLVATTPDGCISLENTVLTAQDLQSNIESLLPEQLKQIDFPPDPELCTYVLRAAHYWGHRGNQVSYQLLRQIPNALNRKNAQIEKLYEEGVKYYLLAAIFRAVNFRLSYPKKYKDYLGDLIQEAPYTPYWLYDWNPVNFQDSLDRFEQFTSPSQAVGDTAHQYRGIAIVQLWTYLYKASQGVEKKFVRETRKVMEITFKLWEKADELLNRNVGEKIIRYYAWTAPLETMVELIEAHSSNELLMDLGEVKRRVNEDMDRLEKEYDLAYPWARGEAIKQTEDFYNILRGQTFKGISDS